MESDSTDYFNSTSTMVVLWVWTSGPAVQSSYELPLPHRLCAWWDGIQWIPWDSHGNDNGNGNECNGNEISIFIMAFPSPSLYLQQSRLYANKTNMLKKRIDEWKNNCEQSSYSHQKTGQCLFIALNVNINTLVKQAWFWLWLGLEMEIGKRSWELE